MVYVDSDPMVVAHSRALKTGAGTAVIHADLREAAAILEHPDTRRLIDFGQPLAILFVSVLQFVGDQDATAAVARFTAAAPPGSYVVLSHITGDPDPARPRPRRCGSTPTTANPNQVRSGAEILGLLDGPGKIGRARPGPGAGLAARRARRARPGPRVDAGQRGAQGDLTRGRG